ncbi:M13 family metallopeptidase [Pseudoxanthomonas wuyuanensis]
MSRAVLCLVAWLLLFPAGLRAAEASCDSAGGEQATALAGEFAPQGVDVRHRSKTVRPGDDFFTFVNEGWIASTPIPDGYWDYGQTSILAATVEGQIKGLLQRSLSSRSPRGTPEQQVGDVYASFLDTAGIEGRGLSSIKADVQAILGSTTREDIARWMANPTSSSIIAINVFPAERRWRVHLDQQNLAQPMLGLSNPDAYTRNDGSHPAGRQAYKAYITAVLERIGADHAAIRAQRLLALETRIAGNFWSLEKLRDRKANYHPMTVGQLMAYAPGFPWRAFLTARGVVDETDIVLGTDTAIQQQARLFADTPLDDWKSYLAFHWVQNQMDVLPESLRQASWDFYGKTLSDAKTPPAREDVALRLVSSAFGHQVGRLYAERYVTERTKRSADEMIAYLRQAFAERLETATWMDEATRAEALAKLAEFSFKVGYPGIWRDFSTVRISRDDAAGNLRRIRAADWEYQRRRLDPAFKHEPWYQTPQTVDASYSVLLNAIELPGAFLQPPYFDADADPAVNFGAIGAIIGHEMGHGFDDQGIVYDSRGRLREWWSDQALERFHDRTRALIDHYDAFAPYPDVHVNGKQTIGENIADLSGVLLAYRAYRMYAADHPCMKRPSLDGLTGDQRFFTAWAQAWRYKAPESAIRHVIEYSYHSPTPYRVNGVVQNIDEWYLAFAVKPGDKLYLSPEKRVRIW